MIESDEVWVVRDKITDEIVKVCKNRVGCDNWIRGRKTKYYADLVDQNEHDLSSFIPVEDDEPYHSRKDDRLGENKITAFQECLNVLSENKQVIAEAREENGVVLADGKTKLVFKERAVADKFRKVMRAYLKSNPSASYGTLKKLAAMCKPLKGNTDQEIIKAFEASTSTNLDQFFDITKVISDAETYKKK